MKTNKLDLRSPHPFTLVAAAAAILMLSAVAGCNKRAEADQTKPASQQSKPDPHAEGDNHAHGGKETHTDEVTLTPDAIERYGIKVEPAQLWVLKPTVVSPARIAFNNEAIAHVGSPLRGRVSEIKVRVGDIVKAGQELLLVESPELGDAQAEFLQKRSAVQTAGPAVDLAKVVWERAKGLYEKAQGISLTEVQRREAEYKVAIAAQKAAESAAMAAENRLHLLGVSQNAIETLAASGEILPKHIIRAAIDGKVVQREVTLGELVSPDRESLLVIADTRTLWVLADVPEAKLAGILQGAKAWVTLGISSGQSVRKFEGQVAFIAPLVDPTTRTAQVRIEVPVTELSLKPGMFAQVEIVSASAGDSPAPVVAVPDDAVQTVEGGPAVFVPVPNEPNTFAKRAVTVGKTVGGLVPIYSGLVEGESFVVAGTFILKAELGKGAAAHEH